ncbi:hypothetical protein [Armatimonas sp.]|uniref:hypothetical protein n=1 Tax=Armatimonas sp. TaxID=1872638 RepID=UPI00286BE3EF|nr:hypothetical protein [Armatimonas sp.]
MFHEDALVDKFRTRKVASLLAYLALHPGNQSREKLLEVLWPELDAARNTLSTNLSYLRRAVEKGLGQPEGALICATRDTIGLQHGNYTVESPSDPERLLPGFYDDFVLQAREKLKERLRQQDESFATTVQAIEPLPAELSPYLGRQDLKQQAKELLGRTRLLTLVGTGGVGKTRLALETLQTCEQQGQTVAWVELSSLTEPEGVAVRIASALGLANTQALLPTLRHLPLVLGLDNCEHLVLAAAKECERLLRACPQLTILATSREPLGIPGETVLRLPGLTEAESALLFCERGQRAQPGWELTPEDRPLLSLLCLRLDGLPLALELAASKLRTQSLSELVQRLEKRLVTLTSGSRIAEPRQQTLRAAIAWSYDLLTPEERLLVVRLAVFQGGWSLALAEAVCGGEGLAAERVAALLDSLVDKSLVPLDMARGVPRYRFLETVQEFLREQFVALPAPEQLRLRHAHFEAIFALAADYPGRNLERQRRWARQLNLEQDNTQQALTFCYEHQPERALAFCNHVRVYWELRGYFQMARQQYELALSLPGAQAPTGDRVTALRELSNAYQRMGNWATAEAVLDRLAELNRALGQPLDSQTCRATLAFNQGDWERSRRLFDEVLHYARTEGTRAELDHAIGSMLQLLLAQGEYPAVRALLEEHRTLFNHPMFLTINQAALDVLEGNLPAAKIGFRTAFSVYRELESHRELGHLIVSIGLLAYREGEQERAAQLFGASEAWCAFYGFTIEQPECGFRQNNLAALRRELGEERFLSALTLGRDLNPECILSLMENTLFDDLGQRLRRR